MSFVHTQHLGDSEARGTISRSAFSLGVRLLQTGLNDLPS